MGVLFVEVWSWAFQNKNLEMTLTDKCRSLGGYADVAVVLKTFTPYILLTPVLYTGVYFCIKTCIFERSKIRMLAVLSWWADILRDGGFPFSKLHSTLEMSRAYTSSLEPCMNPGEELQMVWFQGTFFLQMTSCSWRATKDYRHHGKHFSLVFSATFLWLTLKRAVERFLFISCVFLKKNAEIILNFLGCRWKDMTFHRTDLYATLIFKLWVTFCSL